MKKILSILMILVLVGGVAFAQFEPTFTGDATLSWGIDFGKGKDGDNAKASHGFLNEANASVTMPFVKSGASKGEGDVYAYINLSGVDLGLSADMKGAKATGKIGSVEAKVVFNKFYLTIYNAPNMTTNYATRVVTNANIFGGPFKTGFEGYGTKIGYEDKEMYDLNVGLKLVSNGSWEDRYKENKHAFIELVQIKDGGSYKVPTGHKLYKSTYTGGNEDGADKVANANDTYKVAGVYALWRSAAPTKARNGEYGFGIDFHMVPVEKYLTVDANFNMTLSKTEKYEKTETDWKDSAAMNFGVNLKSSPIEGLNLVLGFDGGSAYTYTDKDSKKSGVFAWALGLGADYKVEKVGTFDLGVYAASKATPYGQGKLVDADKNIKDGLDMAMTFGYKGLPIVENLDIHARVNVFRLLSKIAEAKKKEGYTIPLGLNIGAAYTAKISDSVSIKPYADVWGETNIKNYADGTNTADQKYYFGLAYKLGVEVKPMERLAIDAYFEQGKRHSTGNMLMGTGLMLGLGAPMQKKCDNGRFVLSAKISF